jgi:hypothetical protein
MDEQAKAQAERREAYYEGNFNPGYTPSNMPQPEYRMANAAEYSAFQFGKLNRNLERLIDLLEKKGG